jgi:hypothetical protein
VRIGVWYLWRKFINPVGMQVYILVLKRISGYFSMELPVPEDIAGEEQGMAEGAF